MILHPVLGVGMGGVIIAVALAWRSVAWPLALAGFPPVLFAIVGSNPLPGGGVLLLSAGWILLAIAFVVVRRTDMPPIAVVLAIPTIATLGLVAWMMLRLGASVAPEYGLEKLEIFAVGNLTFLLAAIVVSWRAEHLRTLIAVSFGVALTGAAVLVFQLLTGGAQTFAADRLTISGNDNPISLGRDSAGGLLIGAYLILTVRSQVARLLLVPALLVLVIGLVASGSRGPVVGLVGGVAAFAAFSVSARTVRRRLLAIGAAAITAVLVVPLVVPQAAVSRSLEVFSTSGGKVSSNGRTELWGDAVSAFANHTFTGIGTGGFSGIQVSTQYPHNVLLEVGSELGVVGLALMVLLVADVVLRLVRSAREAADDGDRLLSALVLGLFTTAFVNALFSGAIQDNRVVWLWAGVAVGMTASRLREHAGALSEWPSRAVSLPRA